MLDRYVGIAGLVLAILSLIAPYRWPKVPTSITTAGLYIAILLVGAAIGSFLTHRYGADQEKETPARPEFHLAMMGGNVFVPSKAPLLTGIAIDARIWNTGASSIATGWSLQITPNGGMPVKAQLTAAPNRLTATGEFNNFQMSSDEVLDIRTLQTAVGNAPVSGKLLFYVALAKPLVQAADTRWTLKVKDVYEQETTTSNIVGDWLQR